MARRRKKWTSEELELLGQLYRKKRGDIGAVARFYKNRLFLNVCAALEFLGLIHFDLRPFGQEIADISCVGGWTRAQEDEVKRLYEVDDLSMARISKVIGRTYSATRTRVLKLKLTRKKGSKCIGRPDNSGDSQGDMGSDLWFAQHSAKVKTAALAQLAKFEQEAA